MKGALAAALIVGLTALPATVAADALENLTAGWYVVEAIIFQRTAVSDANTPELLTRTEQRRLPANAQSLAQRAQANAYELDAPTRATLEFPLLTLNCPEAPNRQPASPATAPAWYQPPTPFTPFSNQQPESNGRAEAGTSTGRRTRDGSTAIPSPMATVGDSITRPDDDPPAGRVANTGHPEWDAPAGQPCAVPVADAEATDELLASPVDHCPPLPLDVPISPSTSAPVCGQARGQRPPSIHPQLEPHPLLDWLRAVQRFENQLRRGSFQASLDDARLSRQANRIQNSDGMKLLWHGRWTQPVASANRPRPVFIQAGRPVGGNHELEGFFTITRSGLLQFQAKLWLTHHAPYANAEPPEQTSTGVQVTTGVVSGKPPPYMLLEERRVMRKGQLHYLDHPKLGVLVRADPVRAPAWLADASAAFESAQGGD